MIACFAPDLLYKRYEGVISLSTVSPKTAISVPLRISSSSDRAVSSICQYVYSYIYTEVDGVGG